MNTPLDCNTCHQPNGPGTPKILSSAQVSGAEVLLRQVPSARVTGGIPLLLELTVDRSTAPAPVRNGPIAGRWAVKSSNGDLEGELLVWVKEGYLDGLEFAWVTQERPAGFPSPDRVHPLP